jgi:hypothetical protein
MTTIKMTIWGLTALLLLLQMGTTAAATVGVGAARGMGLRVEMQTAMERAGQQMVLAAAVRSPKMNLTGKMRKKMSSHRTVKTAMIMRVNLAVKMTARVGPPMTRQMGSCSWGSRGWRRIWRQVLLLLLKRLQRLLQQQRQQQQCSSRGLLQRQQGSRYVDVYRSTAS